MDLAHTTATATITTIGLLSFQQPTTMRSWVQGTSMHRSLAIVVSVYLGTLLTMALDGLGFQAAYPYLSFILLLSAGSHLVALKKHSSSIWTSRRILPMTLTAGVTAAVVLSLGDYTSTEFFAALTILSGFMHVLKIRAENAKIADLFGELTKRIATLQAQQFSIQPKSKMSAREDRDIHRNAS